MNLDELTVGTASMLDRLLSLRGRSVDGVAPGAVAGDAIEELQAAIEELRVADEELRAQNDALISAQAAVERERRRYFDLFELAPYANIITDGNGVILEANRAASSLLGRSQHGVIRKPLASWVAVPDRRAFRKRLAALASGSSSKPDTWETRLHPRHGRPIDVAVTADAVRDVDGAVTGIRWIFRDISERKQAEAERQEFQQTLERLVQERTAELLAVNTQNQELLSRELLARVEAEEHYQHLQAVLEQIPEGVLIADAGSRRISLCNRAAQALWGETVVRGDIGGFASGEGPEGTSYLRPDGQPYTGEDFPLARALRGETVLSAEVVLHDAEGARKALLCNASPILDRNRRVSAAVLVAQDITERKALERYKDDYLALAAHQLRSSITVVLMGYTSVTRHLRRLRNQMSRTEAAEAGIPDLLHIVDIARTGTESIVRLVNELLSFSRLEAGLERLALEPTDLVDLIRQVVARQRRLHSGHSIRLERTRDAIQGRWDRVQLEQVFANLLDNASKYTPAGTAIRVRIEVQAEASGTVAHVSVHDEGQGIPTEEIARLFERYYRGRQADGRSTGFGLGLYLSRQIVERHGGRIWAESVPDHGSIFHIILPLERAAISRTAGTPAPRRSRRAPKEPTPAASPIESSSP